MQLHEKLLKAKEILQRSERDRRPLEKTFLQDDCDIAKVLTPDCRSPIATIDEHLDELMYEQLEADQRDLEAERDARCAAAAEKYGRPVALTKKMKIFNVHPNRERRNGYHMFLSQGYTTDGQLLQSTLK